MRSCPSALAAPKRAFAALSFEFFALATLLAALGCGSAHTPAKSRESARMHHESDAGAPDGSIAQPAPDSGEPDSRDASMARPGTTDADAAPATHDAGPGEPAADGGSTDSGSTEPRGACPVGTYFGDLQIRDQRQLSTLRGCKRVTGSLLVGGENIDDLSDLAELTEVGGDFQLGTIYGMDIILAPNTALKTLQGLQALRTVGSLRLVALASVTSLEPLSKLESANNILVSGLASLANLKGLRGVTWTNLQIHDNAGLTSLDGLNVPPAVTSVELSNNPLLASLDALRNLSTLDNLDLTTLPSLARLDGLSGVKPGYETLTIKGCTTLTDLTGLGAYAHRTNLEDNAALRSLTGVSTSEGVETFSIINGPNLANLAGIVPPSQTASAFLFNGLPSLKSLADLNTLREIQVLELTKCDGLVDLTGLSGLTVAGGIAISDCAGIQTLKGLDALERIDTALDLHDLLALTSVQGAPKCQRMGSLRIWNSQILANLQGFESVTQLNTLELGNNLALTSLQGLEKPIVLEELHVTGNVRLPDLTGLGALRRATQLSVSANPSLASLRGTALGSSDWVLIDSNPILKDLAGLENLSNVGDLDLTYNASLASLRALQALTKVKQLKVEANQRLPECEIEWLATRVKLDVPKGQNGPPGMCAP